MRFLVFISFAATYCLICTGCSEGPSAGKRLASEQALRQIEEMYEQRSDQGTFRNDVPIAQDLLTSAEQAGDHSRMEDAQLDMDLDQCKSAITSYQESFISVSGTEKEQSEALQAPLPLCISALKKDLDE